MSPDTWEALFYHTIKSLIACAVPLLVLWFASLLFKDITKSFTGFIRNAMKAEFKTDVGKTNLLGILVLFILLIMPNNNAETSVSAKALIFSMAFLGSLLISGLINRSRKRQGDKIKDSDA